VSIGTTADIVARVLADQVPFGLVEAPVSRPGLEVRTFAEDEMLLVAPPRHPWAHAGVLPPAALNGARLLRREPGSGTQAFVDHMLERSGVVMETSMILGSAEALKQAVLAGIGVAWIPRITAARELAAGHVVAVPVEGLALRRALSLVSPHGLPLPPAGEALLRLLDDRPSTARDDGSE
jgi:DNA-binding transcriptional LysR family regulator